MSKPVKALIKLQVMGGAATPAPPVGTALGPHGINIGDFVSQFNAQTQDKKGSIVPVELTIFEDRTFSFVLKTSPASDLLRKAAKVEKGSGVPHRDKVGSVTKEQVRQIAEQKMEDLSAFHIDQAVKIIEGTARSMGIEVQDA